MAFGGWQNGYLRFGNKQALTTAPGSANSLTRAAIMGKVYKFASKVTSVKNTVLDFVRKHPKTLTATIGITTLLVGVSLANPGLASTGIAAIITAIVYISPATAASPTKPD